MPDSPPAGTAAPIRPFARPTAPPATPAAVERPAAPRPFRRPTPPAPPPVEPAVHIAPDPQAIAVAAALDRVSARLRAGELTLPPGARADDPAAALAVVLAALLQSRTERAAGEGAAGIAERG